MPSAAAVAHAATNFGAPSTCTRQIRQLPTTGSFGYQHNVGTSIASARAASRIVDPAGTVTERPSIVSVGIKTDSSMRTEQCLLSIYVVHMPGNGTRVRHAQLLHPLFHRSIFANSSFLRVSARILRGDIATRLSQDGFSGSSDDRRERLRRFSTAPRESLLVPITLLKPPLLPQLTRHTASLRCSRSTPRAAPVRSTRTCASVAIACSRSARASVACRVSPTTRRSGFGVRTLVGWRMGLRGVERPHSR